MDVKCVCVSARVRVVMMSFRCRNYILFWLHRATFFNKFPCFSCPCHRFSDRLSISSSALNDYSVVLRFGFLCCAFAAQMFPLSSSDMMMMMIKCFQPDPDYREYVVLYIAPLLSDEDLWSRVLREVTILWHSSVWNETLGLFMNHRSGLDEGKRTYATQRLL